MSYPRKKLKKNDILEGQLTISNFKFFLRKKIK